MVLRIPMAATDGLWFVDGTIRASVNLPQCLAYMIADPAHREEPFRSISIVMRQLICRRATGSHRSKRSTFEASLSAARPRSRTAQMMASTVVWGVTLRLVWLKYLEDARVLMAELPLW